MTDSSLRGVAPATIVRRTVPVALLTGAIRIYQLSISPLLGRHCRFAPSCSEYAATAVRRHRVRRGLWLAARRVIRCHPWHAGGWDPVP